MPTRSVYVFVPKSKLTQKMLNLSTAAGCVGSCVMYKDSYIIETENPLHEVFLDYPHYTAAEVREIVAQVETTWWTWFTGLFCT